MEDKINDCLAFRQFLSRRRKSHFIFLVNSPPRSKKSISPNESKTFCTSLRENFFNRFTATWNFPLAVTFHVNITEKDPPHIHTIPKNYLDLCQGIVYKNDSQIEYLAIKYSIVPSSSPWMGFQFYPMSSLRQDLRFASELLLKSSYGSSEMDRNILRAAAEMTEDDELDSPLDNWRQFRRSLPFKIASFGQQLADNLHAGYEKEAQEYLLKNSSIRINEAEALFAPRPRNRGSGKNQFANLQKVLNAHQFLNKNNFSKSLIKSPLRMQLANIPAKKGDTKSFNLNIRSQMRDFKTNHPLFSKLRTPVGLEVLFIPPLHERPVVRDIDNIMKKITPAFHEEFSPPLSPAHTIDLNKLPIEIRDNYIELMKNYPKGLKHQIRNYEIYRVPADRATLNDGQISVGLCDDLSKRDLLSKTKEVINAWWRLKNE